MRFEKVLNDKVLAELDKKKMRKALQSAYGDGKAVGKLMDVSAGIVLSLESGIEYRRKEV